jgi:hypothetical protein
MSLGRGATAESLVKSINRRLQEIEKYFGTGSYEYHKAKNVVWQELGNDYEGLLKYDKGRVTVSRSKRVVDSISGNSTLYDIVAEVWDTIQKQGTVLQQANTYFNYDRFTMKELKNEAIQEYIQDASRAAYRSAYVDDDTYDEVNGLLLEESQKYGTDDYDETFYKALKEIRDVLKTSGVHRDWRYAQAEKMLTDAKMEHEKWLVDQLMKDADKPADAGSNE